MVDTSFRSELSVDIGPISPETRCLTARVELSHSTLLSGYDDLDCDPQLAVRRSRLACPGASAKLEEGAGDKPERATSGVGLLSVSDQGERGD